MTFYLILAASVVILVLVGVALYLHFLLYQQGKKRKQAEQQQEEKLAKQVQQIQQDIQFLSRAYMAGQVELSEVSLRIHKLVDFLSLDGQQRKDYAVFDTVAIAIKDIPTHEQWTALDKKTRQAHRELFENLESEYAHAAKIQAEKLARGINASELH